MFEGTNVALVTPFKNGSVDEDKLRELVEFHVKKKTSVLLPCGTTGESATLSHEEHQKVIEIVVGQAKRRIKVLAGAGSNCTKEAISLTKHAKEVGADGALVICPYYNKPTQNGLYEHFRAIANAVDIPIVIYNIPGRTGINMLPDTVIKVAKECPNIVGIKEASGSLDQCSAISRALGDKFEILSGDDSLTLPILSVGGVGVISVVANIVPDDVWEMVDAYNNGDIKRAKEIHLKLFPLIKAMFIETNPIPVKTAMGLLGMCLPDLRLPMAPMQPQNVEKLKKALRDYGLI
jgi:4-hydroxy-tetrahydrodipicolinate synthase